MYMHNAYSNLHKITFILLILFPLRVASFTINRVILATDAHENYIQFWPIVAKIWKELIGVQPTLALIADESVTVDASLGDVIRFEPIPGVSNALYAQAIRLLLPIMFPNDGCILADIDMIPLSKTYFIDSVAHIPEDQFIVYKRLTEQTYPMCYNAAKGSTFAELFSISNPEDIPGKIKEWAALNLGWSTDEKILRQCLEIWDQLKSRCTFLNHPVEKRIDRSEWQYDKNLLLAGFYIDAHCLRPYKKYKAFIDQLISDLYNEKSKL